MCEGAAMAMENHRKLRWLIELLWITFLHIIHSWESLQKTRNDFKAHETLTMQHEEIIFLQICFSCEFFSAQIDLHSLERFTFSSFKLILKSICKMHLKMLYEVRWMRDHLDHRVNKRWTATRTMLTIFQLLSQLSSPLRCRQKGSKTCKSLKSLFSCKHSDYVTKSLVIVDKTTNKSLRRLATFPTWESINVMTSSEFWKVLMNSHIHSQRCKFQIPSGADEIMRK